MAYQEYNSRSPRSRAPLHLRLYDALRDVQDRYRVGWLLLVLAVGYAGYRVFSARRQSTTAVLMEAAERGRENEPHWAFWERVVRNSSLSMVTDGQAVARELGNGRQPSFVLASIEGLADRVMVSASGSRNSADRRELTAAQIAAFDHIRARYPALRQAVLGRFLEAYQTERERLLEYYPTPEGEEKFAVIRQITKSSTPEEMLPELHSPDALLERLHVPGVHLHKEERDGLAYVSIRYMPEWDVTIRSVVIHGDRILQAESGIEDMDEIVRQDADAAAAKANP